MDDKDRVDMGLWQEFLGRQRMSMDEQEAFLDYLTRPNAPEIESLEALEVAYNSWLQSGGATANNT